jgi:hypothetical protein
MWVYYALHHTEISHTYDGSVDRDGIVRSNYSTNETHVADRQLIRMMLALPDLVLQRGEIFQRSDIRPNNLNAQKLRVLLASCSCTHAHDRHVAPTQIQTCRSEVGLW